MSHNKNVCLATWFGSPNFGTNLQAYALQRIIIDMGFHVQTLSTIPQLSTIGDCIRHWLAKLGIYPVWLFIKALFVEGPKDMSIQIAENPNIVKWSKKTFYSVTIDFPFQIRQLVKKTDCFVAGSDQIWNSYVGFDSAMYLAFAGDKKRISFASSLGTNGINPEHAQQIKEWLAAFAHISVREASSVIPLRALTNRQDIVSVLDPTFLLTKKEWEDFASEPQRPLPVEQPYILCYLIGQNSNYHRQLEDVWEKSGIPSLLIVPACENSRFTVPNATVLTSMSPPEFVWLIQHAEIICTDSYHATALSINHSKAFVEFKRFEDSDPMSQNVRITDLLSHFHLTSRLYNPEQNDWMEPIDYPKAQAILAADRNASFSFLKHALRE